MSVQPAVQPLPEVPSPAGGSSAPPEADGEQHFSCRICLDVPSGPVVTACGHLACWTCLHSWLELHPQAPRCPVCKAPCSKSQVIPIYGAGLQEADPRKCPMPKPSPNKASGTSWSQMVRIRTPPSPWVSPPEFASISRPDLPRFLTIQPRSSVQAHAPTSPYRRTARRSQSWKLPSRW